MFNLVGVLGGHQLTEGFVAALLEAQQYLSQRLLHLLLYEENAVQVVGHHLQCHHLHLWVVGAYVMPCLGYGFTETGQYDMRRIG